MLKRASAVVDGILMIQVSKKEDSSGQESAFTSVRNVRIHSRMKEKLADQNILFWCDAVRLKARRLHSN